MNDQQDHTKDDPPSFGSRPPEESGQEGLVERGRSRIGESAPFQRGRTPQPEAPPPVMGAPRPAETAPAPFAPPAPTPVPDPSPAGEDPPDPPAGGDEAGNGADSGEGGENNEPPAGDESPPAGDEGGESRKNEGEGNGGEGGEIHDPPKTTRLPEPENKHHDTPYPVPENLIWRMGGAKIYGRMGWSWLKKEDPEELARRIAYDQEDVLYDLVTNNDLARHIGVFSGKGGVGKTTTTASLGGKFAKVTGLLTVIGDANMTAGHLANRFKNMRINDTSELAKKHGTLSLMTYLMAVRDGDLETQARFLQAVLRDRGTGAYVIGTDPVRNTTALTQELFREGAFNLVRCDKEGNQQGLAHSVFWDTGTVFATNTNVGVAQVADRYVFTSKGSDDEGVNEIALTMNLLSGGKLTEEGSYVPFKDKVAKSLITISGIEYEQRDYFANLIGVGVKRIFPYPYNDHIGNKGKTPINFPMVPWSAQVQINSVLLALYDDTSEVTDPADVARASA